MCECLDGASGVLTCKECWLKEQQAKKQQAKVTDICLCESYGGRSICQSCWEKEYGNHSSEEDGARTLR